MRYISTRGGVEPVSFIDAVKMGLATDGGLLLPESIPHINGAKLYSWSQLSFQELAFEVMRPYVESDLNPVELEDLISRSYATFTHSEVTPLIDADGSRILELFHGPTAAFKDVALQFLGNLFELLLEKSGEHLNIVGATSGDTGSAAIYGVRGKERINIFILHPQGRVSQVQERQMTTVLDSNVHNIAIQGTFDDGQRIVKELFNDLDFKTEYRLGAVNSINWARIMAQVVYYFYAWARVSNGDPDVKIKFAVPTGNFGDIFAGYIAKRMGLPIEQLILATNQNDILARFIKTGIYQVGDVHPSMSPSMDIQVASNFERYLYLLMDESPEAVKNLMADLDHEGKLYVTGDKLAQVQSDFAAVAVSEDETLAQIKTTYEACGYILDPHTAVGVHAAADQPSTVCLATAHPAKFGEAVEQAIGIEADRPVSLQGLEEKETRCAVLTADSATIKQFMQKTLQNA